MLRFNVPDMSCGHCRAAITEALEPLSTALEFDLAARELRVAGADAETVLEALDDAGYSAQFLG